jgi:hypothetical protein
LQLSNVAKHASAAACASDWLACASVSACSVVVSVAVVVPAPELHAASAAIEESPAMIDHDESFRDMDAPAFGERRSWPTPGSIS